MADIAQHHEPGSHPDMSPPASEIGVVGWLLNLILDNRDRGRADAS